MAQIINWHKNHFIIILTRSQGNPVSTHKSKRDSYDDVHEIRMPGISIQSVFHTPRIPQCYRNRLSMDTFHFTCVWYLYKFVHLSLSRQGIQCRNTKWKFIEWLSRKIWSNWYFLCVNYSHFYLALVLQ